MKEEKNNIITIALVIGFIAISMLYAFKSGTPDITVADQVQRETITVSETVEKETMPDEASVYVDIKTRAEAAADAKNENAEISDAVLEALYSYGIEKEDIETSSYYLSEDTKWDKDAEEYIVTGYVLTHTLKITTEDIDIVGEIIDTAVNAGAAEVNSVKFSLSRSKESEIKEEVLALAAEKAKTKAENIVDAIGVGLGELVSISESSYYNSYPWYARSAGYELAVMEEKSSDTSISPQELTVSATVTLSYEIEQ